MFKKTRVIFYFLLILFLLSSCVNNAPHNEVIESEESQINEVIESKESQIDENSSFEVHFIDVEQADAALIIADEETMLIDGGNPEDSSRIVAYLKKLGISKLNHLVCTHAHDDHVGGLPGALSYAKVENVYAPKTESNIDSYMSFKEKVVAQGLTITNPIPGSSFDFGSSVVQFLGPITENKSDLNNTSIVLKISYGDTSFLFTGDAEREEEREIINAGYDLSATVLKVGHHGGETSTSYVFLREIMPEVAVISVGKENNYGHPTEETLSRLRDANVKVYRTDMQGDIVIVSDGKNVVVNPSKNKNANTISIPDKTEKPDNDIHSNVNTYIGNSRSKKFHLPSCYSLPKEKNRVYFNSRTEAINNGFSPCGNCIGK